MRKKQKNGMLQKMLMAAVFLLVLTVIPPQTARAASGTVYTCSVTPSYSNPVTGEIEDAGGEAGYATGQGMVQSVVYSTGILEVTDSGEYYLTVRLGMMDYASGHSFWVQNVGDSGWSAPAVGQTGSGSDGNGTTADICIQVPSENCVVRASMYVEPMGREVIYYFYPSGYSEGNTTDMTATMVTAASGSSETANNTSGASTNASASSVASLRLPLEEMLCLAVRLPKRQQSRARRKKQKNRLICKAVLPKQRHRLHQIHQSVMQKD